MKYLKFPIQHIFHFPKKIEKINFLKEFKLSLLALKLRKNCALFTHVLSVLNTEELSGPEGGFFLFTFFLWYTFIFNSKIDIETTRSLLQEKLA